MSNVFFCVLQFFFKYICTVLLGRASVDVMTEHSGAQRYAFGQFNYALSGKILH